MEMSSTTQTNESKPFKKCTLCGREFEFNPSRWWRIFCSDECKKENHYRDLKEARRIRRERREAESKEGVVR